MRFASSTCSSRQVLTRSSDRVRALRHDGPIHASPLTVESPVLSASDGPWLPTKQTGPDSRPLRPRRRYMSMELRVVSTSSAKSASSSGDSTARWAAMISVVTRSASSRADTHLVGVAVRARPTEVLGPRRPGARRRRRRGEDRVDRGEAARLDGDDVGGTAHLARDLHRERGTGADRRRAGRPIARRRTARRAPGSHRRRSAGRGGRDAPCGPDRTRRACACPSRCSAPRTSRRRGSVSSRAGCAPTPHEPHPAR